MREEAKPLNTPPRDYGYQSVFEDHVHSSSAGPSQTGSGTLALEDDFDAAVKNEMARLQESVQQYIKEQRSPIRPHQADHQNLNPSSTFDASSASHLRGLDEIVRREQLRQQHGESQVSQPIGRQLWSQAASQPFNEPAHYQLENPSRRVDRPSAVPLHSAATAAPPTEDLPPWLRERTNPHDDKAAYRAALDQQVRLHSWIGSSADPE